MLSIIFHIAFFIIVRLNTRIRIEAHPYLKVF
jgi:hypothetical protein